MGAKLIFKNADFSRNAIIGETEELTDNVEWSAGGWQYLNASNMNHAYQARPGLTHFKIGKVNVSQYVGRRLQLTISCPTGWNSTTLASNIVFGSAASNLPTSSPSSSSQTVQNAVSAVEDVTIPESEFISGPKTLVLTVPSGAVYLVFKNNFSNCPYPALKLVEE